MNVHRFKNEDQANRCPSCKAHVSDQDRVCPVCGESLGSARQPAARSAKPASASLAPPDQAITPVAAPPPAPHDVSANATVVVAEAQKDKQAQNGSAPKPAPKQIRGVRQRTQLSAPRTPSKTALGSSSARPSGNGTQTSKAVNATLAAQAMATKPAKPAINVVVIFGVVTLLLVGGLLLRLASSAGSGNRSAASSASVSGTQTLQVTVIFAQSQVTATLPAVQADVEATATVATPIALRVISPTTDLNALPIITETATVPATSTVMPTPTATHTPTSTPSPTETPKPTGTAVPTWTPKPTRTALPTDTPEPTATAVPPTATPKPTSTALPTDTPAPTATNIPPTSTPRPTATRTALPTDTPEPTATDVPPTATPQPTWTPRPTHTAVSTDTPEPTATYTDVPPTSTPRPTALPTSTRAPTATNVPPTATPLPAPTSTTAGGPVRYAVKAGDTCLEIANRFGISLVRLVAYNKFDAKRCFLNIDQIVLIPTDANGIAGVEKAQPTATRELAPPTAAPTALLTRTPVPTLLPTVTSVPVGTPVIYAVKPGDTCGGIANKFGIRTITLTEANNLSSQVCFLRVGQQLVIPINPDAPVATATPEPVTYAVRPGDSCLEIATRFGISVNRLATANALNPRTCFLQVGRKLLIPTATNAPGVLPEPATPTPLLLPAVDGLSEVQVGSEMQLSWRYPRLLNADEYFVVQVQPQDTDDLLAFQTKANTLALTRNMLPNAANQFTWSVQVKRANSANGSAIVFEDVTAPSESRTFVWR